MNDDMMNENDQGHVNPTQGDISGGTATSSTITSGVHPNENESSQQNNNNLEEQVVNKKAKLGEETSAPTSASSAAALRRKSSNNNEPPLSPSKSFPNATNHNSFSSSSSLTTSPRLGFGLLKEQGSNNKAAATDGGYYSNSYDEDTKLQQHHFPNAETQLDNNNYLSSTSSTTGQLKDDRVYEREQIVSSNNNSAATDDNNDDDSAYDDKDNKECGLLQFSEAKSDRKNSRKKSRSNPKPKLAHWLKNIAKDLASSNNGDDINDEEYYLAAQSSIKQRLISKSHSSHSAGVYIKPSTKSTNDGNKKDNEIVSIKKLTSLSVEEQSTHFLSNIANDLSVLSNISQAVKDGIMSLSTNTELNPQGPSVRQEGGRYFAKGHTSNPHVFTTSGGKCHKRIYLCYHNNILALTGVLGSVYGSDSGDTIFPIHNIFHSTKLPGSNRSILDVIGSDTTVLGLMGLFKAHSAQKRGNMNANTPLLGSLMITVSKNGRYLADEVGPKEAFGSWVEAVKVYDDEMRTSKLLGFSATTPSLRNLVVLKKEHLGTIVDQLHRLSTEAQAMLVAVYDPLRVALREFGSQRQLLGIEETPSLQEVIPIVTETFARILILENAVTDSGMSFIADMTGNLPEAIIGDLNSAGRQSLNVMITTGGFNCGIAPQSSHTLVRAQITALIVVLNKFGFGEKSVSPKTRRSIIMGICKCLVLFDSHTYVIHKLNNLYFPTVDNVLRWKWAIKMVRMTDMFSQEVWYKISTNLNRDDLPAVLLEEDEDE